MAAVQDLPSDPLRGTAQPNAAKVGRSRAAHSGDAVASKAALCLECEGTALSCLGTSAGNSWRYDSEQDGEDRQPSAGRDSATNNLHRGQILSDLQRESSRFGFMVPCSTEGEQRLE